MASEASTDEDFKELVLLKPSAVKTAASTKARANGKDWGKMSWQERLAEIDALEKLQATAVQIKVLLMSGELLTEVTVSGTATGNDVKILSQKSAPAGTLIHGLTTEDGRLVGDDEQAVLPHQAECVLHASIVDWSIEPVPVTVTHKRRGEKQKDIVINLSASDTGEKVEKLLLPLVVSSYGFTNFDRLYFASGETTVNVDKSSTLSDCGFIPGQHDLICSTSVQLGQG